jgi:hypothetical protein
MKKYYFLVSLPRSGNTLLGSILNQNKKISVTANSIVPEILWQLNMIKNTSLLFKNFPDEKSYSNIINKVFELYYKDWNSEIIIDRSRWGSDANIDLLNKYCPNKPKFIILVRPIEEVLASFIKWSEENPYNFINSESPIKTIEGKCDFLMSPELQIVQEYSSIYNIMKKYTEDDYILITYDDLVNNTEYEIKKIYDFLNMENYNHRFFNIDEFSVNGYFYNDLIVGNNLHKVNKNIKKNEYSIYKYLPKHVIEKYSNLNFWQECNK